MKFLSNGDFSFPFNWHLYFTQQFYVWSYQNGASNPDGIIRVPIRLIDVIVFALFGNIAVSYFYILSSFLICYLSYFYFSSKFLNVKNRLVKNFGALLFTFNPIFLGNASKIGLVVAVAMLPLCLIMVKKTFDDKKLRYLLLLFIFLTLSLVHPFTFAVNFMLSSIYFIRRAWRDRQYIRRIMPQLVFLGLIYFLCNVYFLLPIASMHTLSKGVLSNTITNQPVNYAALVNVLNTGDILTGLSLSRYVVLDYRFYNNQYADIYFLGIFIFYAILLGIFVKVQNRITPIDKKRFIVALIFFAVMIALATVLLPGVGNIIRFLINTPGGWAFRSPLKWQLYIPIAIVSMLLIVLKYLNGKSLRLIVGFLAVSFVMMNGFLFFDIYKRLLTPRSIQYFSSLQSLNLNHKNILFVSSYRCNTYEYNNPAVAIELNEILLSKNTQVKNIDAGDVGEINLDAYSYILGCEGDMNSDLSSSNDFRLAYKFDTNNFQLYRNEYAVPYITSTSSMYELGQKENIEAVSKFSQASDQNSFNTLSSESADVPTTGMQDVFGRLTTNNIHNNIITTKTTPVRPGKQELRIKYGGTPLYYLTNNTDNISLSTEPLNEYEPLIFRNNIADILLDIPANSQLTVSYVDPSYKSMNLIPNSQLKSGLWQKSVGDCYDYDDNPEIQMGLHDADAPGSLAYLQLSASNHIACTGPGLISVAPGRNYLLNFKYQNPTGDGGYYISYGSNLNPVSVRLDNVDNGWQAFNTVVKVPDNSDSLHLLFEAYPNYLNAGWGTANYSDFILSAIPNIQGRFYLESDPTTKLSVPSAVTYETHGPTLTTIHINQAKQPFYLVSNDTYSRLWELSLGYSSHLHASSGSLDGIKHIEVNSTMNGWYINPSVLCVQQIGACHENSNGTYNVSLVASYVPQKWFVSGLIISGTTLVGCLLYFPLRQVISKRRRPSGETTS